MKSVGISPTRINHTSTDTKQMTTAPSPPPVGPTWSPNLLHAIASRFGTPVYVYQAALIDNAANAYLAAAGENNLVAFALKANNNMTLLKRLARLGLGADVTSGGELFLAEQAGFKPEKRVFSGVGKLASEIIEALERGVRALHVESAAELELIEAIGRDRNRSVPVGFRLNPNVDPQTHPYISTGLHENKFGIPIETGIPLIAHAHRSEWLTPVGIAAHIGSQIRTLAPYQEAVDLLVSCAVELRSQGISLAYIDVGGGWGIDYGALASAETMQHEIERWVTVVKRPVEAAGFRFVAEPGRSIIGPAGALLTAVQFVKPQGEKRFVIVDAGMNDLIRPTLYQATHPIFNLSAPPRAEDEGQSDSAASNEVEIVGPICESGDFLGKGVSLPATRRGDLIGLFQAGAYGFAMSSRYNGRLRPAEVLVEEDESVHLIRPRERYEDLLST